MANTPIFNNKQTVQQQRAAFALNEISKIAEKNKGKISAELASFIVGMPTMILANGIGQTFAFLLSKVHTGFLTVHKLSAARLIPFEFLQFRLKHSGRPK